MEETRYSRSELLFGKDSTPRLRQAHVGVFGIGGVGSYLTEALARMGVGHLTLVDNDVYSVSNLNRQLFCTLSTLGQYKTDAAKKRIEEIDPSIRVDVIRSFVLPGNIGDLPLGEMDFIADAIDTVSAKVALAEAAYRLHVPIIGAMGTGNRTTAEGLRVLPIEKTQGCPLARVMRRELNKRGIKGYLAVSSSEASQKTAVFDPENGKPIPGSCSFVPSVAGLLMAGEIVRRLLSD
ncbi:MAG: ThiF family adenylyltransferase [Clostridia bacterium]|nr:ThiF family adenylyltransferase [Clostridia bacterium]